MSEAFRLFDRWHRLEARERVAIMNLMLEALKKQEHPQRSASLDHQEKEQRE